MNEHWSNINTYGTGEKMSCPVCGSDNIQRRCIGSKDARGILPTEVYCQSCGFVIYEEEI